MYAYTLPVACGSEDVIHNKPKNNLLNSVTVTLSDTPEMHFGQQNTITEA